MHINNLLENISKWFNGIFAAVQSTRQVWICNSIYFLFCQFINQSIRCNANHFKLLPFVVALCRLGPCVCMFATWDRATGPNGPILASECVRANWPFHWKRFSWICVIYKMNPMTIKITTVSTMHHVSSHEFSERPSKLLFCRLAPIFRLCVFVFTGPVYIVSCANYKTKEKQKYMLKLQ